MERLDKDGFAVLDQVIDPALIDALRAEYERQYPDVEAAPDRYRVDKGRLQVSMRLEGPFLSPELYANPRLLALAEEALGSDFVIDNFSLVTALPGAPDQGVHIDHPDLYPGEVFTRAVIQPYALNVAIPLVDLSPETGTTKLFPRTHKRHSGDGEFELPYVERGGCYVVDYRLAHQGTANRSKVERPILYLTYARSWFTDTVNYGNNIRINIRADDLPAIPAQHRRLFQRLAAKGGFDRTIDGLFA